MKNVLIGHDSLTRMYHSLEMTSVMEKTIDFFGDRMECENIFWFSAAVVSSLRDFAAQTMTPEIQRQLDMQVFVWKWETDCLTNAINIAAGATAVATQSSINKSKSNIYNLTIPCFTAERDRLLGVLVIQNLNETDPSEIATQIGMSLACMSRFIQFAYDYRAAKNLSFSDDLTGLYNQRYLQQIIDREILLSARENKKFGLLFVDVDYFKLINDSSGHIIGSQVLVELGKIIKASVRETDYAFRYGGDEFVVLLVNTDQAQSQQVAERLRSRVEQTKFHVDGIDVKLTVSIGLATFPDHAQTREQILKMADQAMYYGKYKSRNVVYKAS